MKKVFIFLYLLPVFYNTNAQQIIYDDSLPVQNLQEVIIKAYEQRKKLIDVPAAINYIAKSQLDRFNNTSILPALNVTPGVRMEERSPGSYRLNIRGSTLRSPFGVRNVKIYWNGIPFTDPGGTTYLNQLGYYNFNSIEIIKGPASSMYGAGTGGAVLINSQPGIWSNGIDLAYVRGSFDMSSLNIELRAGNDDHLNRINYTHQSSDGYRDHTNMRRDVVTMETQIKANDKQQLNASVLYGDLYYQTPGGLTKTEYNNNPKAARPNADLLKSAIYQQTFLTGLVHNYQFNTHFQNSSVVYGAFSLIKNPTFLNYEKRTEPHFGGRTVFTWQQQLTNTNIQVLFGGEGQRGFFNTKTFKNKQGNPDTLLTDDEINNWIYSAFVQTDIQFPGNWSINAGMSINKSFIKITRLSVPSFVPAKRTYNSEWAPRLAVSKKVIPNVMLYASISKGFSPPTAQEILPSTSVISTG
ncbi:MAG: TonB-dependent receptor, partial [Bacteroidota bacterium]|nr:TonB-dependent receptor [Bacteroidota bacterium]